MPTRSGDSATAKELKERMSPATRNEVDAIRYILWMVSRVR